MTDPRDEAQAARTMPSNIEAEQALLGCVMFDNAAFERLPDGLKGSHFYEPFHQRLFDAIESSIAAGALAEPTILMDRFKADPAFEEFGGLRYLADLVDRAPPAFGVRDYGRTIMDLAMRRDLMRIGGEIIGEAANPDKTAKDLLTEAEGALFGLAETGGRSEGVQTFTVALDGAMEAIEAAYMNDGKLTGIATGLADLDQKLGGLHPSDLLILAGRPSMGKTALATNIAFNVAKNYRWEPDPEAPDGRKTIAGGRVLFPSLEMSKEQLAQRILADASGVSSDRMRKGAINEAEFRRIRECRDLIASIPLHIDATGGLHIAKLAARARRHKRQHGLDLIIVDYLQLITTDGGKGNGRVQEVSAITGALKALAKELNVPIIALSQLSRQVENREDKRPQLSDLRESGSIEQDADCVMFVYRESYYLSRAEPKEGTNEHLLWQSEMAVKEHEAEVIIGKQRHGPIGTVKLAFDADTTRFGNLARASDYDTARMPYGED
jgi:replicative DNA helicase